MSLDLNKIKEYLNSPEGQAEMEKWVERTHKDREHNDRWIQRFKDYVDKHGINSVMQKLYDKYNSDAYGDRECRKGIEPRTKLLWLALDYASVYGIELESSRYSNMFTSSIYQIGNWVIQCMNGQGSVVRLDKIELHEQVVEFKGVVQVESKEDGGQFLMCQLDAGYETPLYIRFCSWDETKQHKHFNSLVGKEIVITLKLSTDDV